MRLTELVNGLTYLVNGSTENALRESGGPLDSWSDGFRVLVSFLVPSPNFLFIIPLYLLLLLLDSWTVR